MDIYYNAFYCFVPRLFGPHASDDPYPWESPELDLKEARRLIEKHGYWRRKEEL